MNRNEVIGTVMGKTPGYAVQGFVYYEIASAINPQSAFLLKTGKNMVSGLLNILLRITLEQILKAKQSSQMQLMQVFLQIKF